MYSIKLVNYSFDDTYSNIRLFDDKVSRETFFDNLQGTTQNVENFNAGNLLQTQVVFDANVSIPLTKLLNFNYCIVKLLDENGGISSENESLYFHIKRCQQGSQQRIIIDLEIDPFMTYWYDIEFSDCLITRAHLDRFIKNTNGTYSFDGRAISNLFEREDIKDVPKRLVERKKLKLFTTAGQDVNNWLNDKVICWCYVLIGTTTLKITNLDGGDANKIDHVFESTLTNYATAGDYVNYGFKVLCYPIYKPDLTNLNFSGQIRIQTLVGNKKVYINSNGFDAFVKENGLNDVYAIKLSMKPPIKFANNYTQCEVVGDDLVIRGIIQTDGTMAISTGEDSTIVPPKSSYERLFATQRTGVDGTNYTFNGMFDVFYDSRDAVYFDLDLTSMPQITFNKNEIVGVERNKNLNPKINSMDYKFLRLTFGGSSYDFDIQKLNRTTMRFAYTEMITIDVSKGILRLYSVGNENVFNNDYRDSFNGFLFTNDLTLPYSIGAYETFIANNKNAYLSFQNQQTYALASSVTNIATKTAGSLASMNPLNMASSAISSAGELAQTGLKIAYDSAQFNLSIDNMKNAPDTMSNANGNAIFISAVAEFGIYAELYSGLDAELNIANDYQFENGYYFNQYGNIKEFCCTRKYFNYIQAVPDNIVGNLSNELKQHIKNVLSRGVRFWHVDEISYSLENYEQSLEEEA